jgi:hypothetical protein
VTEGEQVRLRGVLDKTASWARIAGDGSLVVELYDFSADAEKWFGNDVAFLLHVAAADKPRMLARLRGDVAESARDDAADAVLLRLVRERFDDYYAVKEWLDREGIAYRKEFEPWA